MTLGDIMALAAAVVIGVIFYVVFNTLAGLIVDLVYPIQYSYSELPRKIIFHATWGLPLAVSLFTFFKAQSFLNRR